MPTTVIVVPRIAGFADGRGDVKRLKGSKDKILPWKGAAACRS
jgi:hypothetical protein